MTDRPKSTFAIHPSRVAHASARARSSGRTLMLMPLRVSRAGSLVIVMLPGIAGYLPRQTGSRFSAKARNPSIWSSLS